MKAARARLDRATLAGGRNNSTSNNQRQLGSWNLRTMQSELSVSEKGVVEVQGGGLGKLPNLILNLKRFGIGLAAISEHRWKGKGEIQFEDWKFLFSGRSEDQKGTSGVGLVLSPDWVKAWGNAGNEVVFVSDGVMKTRFQFKGRLVTVISIYAPTHQRSEQEKEIFWQEIRNAVLTTPSGDLLVVMGDFNARVGKGGPEVSPVLGPNGPPEVNDAGERLIEFCEENGLFICTTKNKKSTRGSWFHPRSRKWYMIDHIIVRQRDEKLVSKAYPIIPAECHTDHRLVRASIQIKPLRDWTYSRTERSKGRETRLNVRRLGDEKVKEQFNRQVRVELGTEQPTESDQAEFEKNMTIYMDGSSTGRRPERRKGG